MVLLEWERAGSSAIALLVRFGGMVIVVRLGNQCCVNEMRACGCRRIDERVRVKVQKVKVEGEWQIEGRLRLP